MNNPSGDYRVQMRRHDRAMEENQIKDFLSDAEFGTVGSCEQNQTFLTNLLFYFDSKAHAIYLHTFKTGQLVSNIQKNPRVCFSAAELGRYLPAHEALEFSVEYQSVVIFGSAEVIEDSVEAKEALQGLLDKHFPHLKPDRDYRSTTDDELRRTAVIRIQIENWSGKEKQVADDFPGAF